METVIIVIHLMVIVALVTVVLLQRSDGGALGIGGGNAFLSTRGQGNVLTRATGILAAAFFITSIALTVLSRLTAPPSAILDTVPTASSTSTTAPAATGTATTGAAANGATAAGAGAATTAAPTSGGVLNQLNQYMQGAPGAAGTTTAPAATGVTTTAPAVPTSQ